MKDRHVVVTTDKDRRGVFFGTLISQDNERGLGTLEGAKMCVFWSQATKGVLGLASHGPAEGSKITPEIPRIELNGVTSIMDCTEIAVARWAGEIWG